LTIFFYSPSLFFREIGFGMHNPLLTNFCHFHRLRQLFEFYGEGFEGHLALQSNSASSLKQKTFPFLTYLFHLQWN
jgi:hypothetical protein